MKINQQNKFYFIQQNIVYSAFNLTIIFECHFIEVIIILLSIKDSLPCLFLENKMKLNYLLADKRLAFILYC